MRAITLKRVRDELQTPSHPIKRKATRGRARDLETMEIKKVAVIGAGDMGHGIGQLFATGGYEVTMMDKYPEMLEKAKERIGASLQRWVERGRVTKEQADAISSRIKYTGNLSEAVSGADLVVEAVPESLELKRSVVKDVFAHAPDGAIFASNTSNIRISDIASGASRPERVVGMHFFNPPTSMKLVEVIPGTKTDPAVMDAVADVSAKIGRTPVKVLKDSPGFIVNRLLAADSLFLCLILDKGVATPAELDTYFRSQGMPMGPYELTDFVGIDIAADQLSYFAQTLSPEYGKGITFAKMVKEGNLGKKTGKGFYDWSTSRAAIPKATATDKVSTMDTFAIEINEAVKLIEEGVAMPEDIEKGYTLGRNFPFGPISVAKDLTNAEVKSKLEELATKFDCKIFAPAHAIQEGKLRDAIEGRLSPQPAAAQAAKAESKAAPEAPKAGGPILLERLQGGVARIVLNRPKYNTINGEVLDGLDRIITEIWGDPEIRVVVVTGEGSIFSSGADLGQFFSNQVAFMEFNRRGERIMRRLTELPKLTIAVMKGYALGGGLELAASCDIRLATEDVQIGFPEVTRGIVPGWSGTQRIPRLIGLTQAASLVLTSERVKGQRAVEIGLATKLIPPGDPDEYALKYAAELAQSQAPVAVMLAKRLLNKGAEVPSDVGLEMEAAALGILFGTEDIKEGVAAFLAKRKAEFKGK
jgi:enoyl-CoA hydratase / 3-hydroxyacyl-CoA dehydrogenase